jgi:hypothetical protein
MAQLHQFRGLLHGGLISITKVIAITLPFLIYPSRQHSKCISQMPLKSIQFSA